MAPPPFAGFYAVNRRNNSSVLCPAMHPSHPGPPEYVPVPLPAVTLDGLERFLVAVFLRRYVTYSVRRRSFESANGAAALFRRITSR